MIDGFESLKLKLDYLQSLVDTKQNDLNNLKEAFGSNVNYYNNLVEKQRRLLDSIKNESSVSLRDPNQLKILNLFSNFSDITKVHSFITEMRSDFERNRTFNHIINIDVDLPKSVDFLPHLVGKSNLIQPKFKLSRNRFASIVIGVPTIKREKTSYLLETLKSLFDAMNDLEKTDALVVVMIAEVTILKSITINKNQSN